MTTRALIYSRVSQDRANGRSPAEQEAEARLVCEREGWTVTEVVTDSLGASRHSKGKRNGWAKAQQLLADGSIDVLVTWEASRAQRDLAAYAELRDLCVANSVRWSYSGRTYDMAASSDRFTTGLDALLAEREADETAERVRRAMRANAAKGLPAGRRLFGYKRVYDENTGTLTGQMPHPTEADVVRRIFAAYVGGGAARTICDQLNRDGIPTGTGGTWSDPQIRRVLVNPAYVARRVHQGKVIGPGNWPALVDVERFERVQARLAAQRAASSRNRSTSRLLTGVARCGVCGAKCGAIHDRRHRNFYVCRGVPLHPGHEGTRYCVARDLVKLDAFVSEQIVDWLGQPAIAQRLGSVTPDPAVEAARDLATTLRAQLDDAIEEFSAGRLSAATLGRVETDVMARIEAAERLARSAIVPLEFDVPITNLAEWWEALPAETRRAFVGALISAVVILPVGVGRRTFDPAGVRIEWRR